MHKEKSVLIENGERTMEESNGDCMDVASGLQCKGSSELCFLKRVLLKEMGTDFSDTKLVFLAVHAVFLESGFVGFDPISNLRVDFFDVLKEQSSMTFTTTVRYTLPGLLSSDNVAESVLLKFLTLGHYVNVFGWLASSPETIHKLNIDKSRFVPAIGHFWATDETRDRLIEMDSTRSRPEKVILEFWRIVKDSLALYLMMDIREKTGLDIPICWKLLPADLKVHILELLNGQDREKAACVSKELYFLSSKGKKGKKWVMLNFPDLSMFFP